jgi:hypothetical protein
MSRHPSSNGSTLETLALLGAVVLITMPAWKGISRRWRIRHPRAASERMIDEALKYTYPASDPPATRIFDIPVNRR